MAWLVQVTYFKITHHPSIHLPRPLLSFSRCLPRSAIRSLHTFFRPFTTVLLIETVRCPVAGGSYIHSFIHASATAVRPYEGSGRFPRLRLRVCAFVLVVGVF